jgi:RNA polymerase sigma factor (sigma-70 family)
MVGVDMERPMSDAPRSVAPFTETFEVFYRAHRRPVIGLAYVLSGSRWGAEELAQEAFLAAYRRWDTVAAYDDPGAWVRRVLANRAASRFRRMRLEAATLLRLDRHRQTLAEGDPDADDLWAEVRRLPRRQAQTLALHYLDDRSVAHIASVLGISEASVKTHVQRGKKALADRLGLEQP